MMGPQPQSISTKTETGTGIGTDIGASSATGIHENPGVEDLHFEDDSKLALRKGSTGRVSHFIFDFSYTTFLTFIALHMHTKYILTVNFINLNFTAPSEDISFTSSAAEGAENIDPFGALCGTP